MKARVKATGEIYDIEAVSVRLTGKAWSAMGLDEVEVLMPDLTPDYWTRLEHQYAGMAMQGLCANYTEFTKDNDGTVSNTEMIVENARIIAHALVEKMKEVK